MASIAPIGIEEVMTTDPMDILRYNGRGGLSRNLLTRVAAYDAVRSQTVLPIHQFNTLEREMNV